MKKILVAGATGNLGPHLVKEFAQNGHQVSALIRPASMSNNDKVGPLRALDVRLISGDLNDQSSLERACQDQDVIVSAVGGEQIMLQNALAQAAANAGVERFIPSEFGVDPIAASENSCDLFDIKTMAQQQIKATGVPTTMVYNNGFMEFWGTGLGQLGPTSPPSEVQFFGDGSAEITLTTLGDIARFTRAIIEDPDTINREVLIANNKINQEQLIQSWEQVSGQSVKRIPVSADDLENLINSSQSPEDMMQRIFAQLHRSVWVRGDGEQSRDEVIDASSRYPDIPVTTLRQYFSNFV